ncbi:MAG: amidophosphoribosyltransferase [Thermoplasmata archaeon]|nr:MAG: amidophosphoribosyltransferase [Thermoplasmata archaeon]
MGNKIARTGLVEKCGVVGAASGNLEHTPKYLYYGLYALQHRGQEAAGIAVWNKDVRCHKGLGLVSHIFSNDILSNLAGNRGIGHTYYSIKLSVPENAQPHIVKTHVGDIAIAHNGIIVNSEELKSSLMKEGHVFVLGSEEEAMAYILARGIKDSGNVWRAIYGMMRKIKGSYALTIMINDRVFGVRDPYGIKPLCVGELDGGYGIASESVVFDVLGGRFLYDILPGEVVEITEDGVERRRFFEVEHTAHCFFEYVYFARADSVLDGREVYSVRRQIGRVLADEHPANADVVIPVPDSGRAQAYGFSEKSGIPIAEGLMKNRYSQRTFIMPTQLQRELSVRAKLNVVRSVVDGARVVLVDDSIVRGTTMRKIVRMLRKAGAKEVHVRIGSPPIIAPCYFGIDMTTRDQLIASGRTIDEIRRIIGADSLNYISVDGLVKAIGVDRNDLCLGCVTAEYPMNIPGEKHRFQERLDQFI